MLGILVLLITEGKNTINGESAVNDIGVNMAPERRTNILIVGNENEILTASCQHPNLTGNTTPDNWIL